MQKPRSLPTLDFLKGFDAAARHLSFTEAAAELFLTQSALSRQIKALEEQIGHPLFMRGHRSLELSEAGEAFRPVVRGALADLGRAVAAIRARGGVQRVSVSTTVPFASLWLIPRLPRFREAHPEVEVFVSADNQLVDLARGQIDVAVRYGDEGRAPAGAVRLFGEQLVPVVSPALLRDGSRPLRNPGDLARHVLLHLEDPLGRTPWVNWETWLVSSGVPGLAPAGNLRFSQYDLLLQATISGQGVGLGRSPLIDHALARGELATPFPKRYGSPRGYFALCAAGGATRPEVGAFIQWLEDEATRDAGANPAVAAVAVVRSRKRSPPRATVPRARPARR
jgi:DNA-binding transcriptional LysR family regulator